MNQGRVIFVWLSWLVGGICGVIILLVFVCYCRLMPRHQKSFDEQYLKEHYSIKETHAYNTNENYKIKHVEAAPPRSPRPASYAGAARHSHSQAYEHTRTHSRDHSRMHTHEHAHSHARTHVAREPDAAHYASSSMLDDIDSVTSADALKTRSLPSFRPKQRPLSTEDDLQQLYAKVNLSKKYKNRMRSEHAAIIALSKSHSHFFDAEAVIVYDQRTAL